MERGKLYAGVRFDNYCQPYWLWGPPYVAMREGTGWRTLGSGNNEILALAADGRGNLYAGGWFTTAGDVPADHIADGMAPVGALWVRE